MKLTRRRIALAGAALLAPSILPVGPAFAYGSNQDDAMRPETLFNDAPREIIPLWPRRPPGAPRVSPAQEIIERSAPPNLRDRVIVHVARPVMTVFRPERPNGAALLITPGGGYQRVVLDKEGYEIGEWFAARGVTCFVLFYRLPGDGWAAGPDVSLQDAQRAMRLIRARAGEFGIDPARIASLGCSAGGHVAASLALRFDRPAYARAEAADDLSARPDASILLYPVVTMGEWTHPGSRRELLDETPSAEAIDAYSLERHARADAPPAFFIHAADDEAVPSYNTLSLCHALHQAGVPSELHIFERGGHGFGLRGAVDLPARAWPDLALNWLGARGFF